MDIKIATQIFLEIKNILDQVGVKFWLVDGVALGAVRDNGFIPHDSDIDLRVMATDWDFAVLFKEFEKNGFRCVKTKITKLYGNDISGSVVFKRGIKVDICLGYYYPPEDVIVVLAAKPHSNYDILPAKFFRGDHFINFYGEKARIPYPAEEYLEMHYGKGWKTPTKEKHASSGLEIISLSKYVDYFRKHLEINQLRR